MIVLGSRNAEDSNIKGEGLKETREYAERLLNDGYEPLKEG